MNFNEQSEAWLTWLATRKRRPAKPASLAKYRSTLKKWILPRIGAEDLETFGNGALKKFVTDISQHKLAPKTILDTVGMIKEIISSAEDLEGNELHPRKWNNEFLDLPIVDPTKQKTPMASKQEITRVLKSTKHRVLFALLAGTGMRIGEALAIRVGFDGEHTGFDFTSKTIYVRTAFWKHKEMATPKTQAGVRDIDLCSSLSSLIADYAALQSTEPTPFARRFLFANRDGNPLWEMAVRNELSEAGIKGFHAFRRFRNTHLLEAGVPSDILKYWMGHQGDGSMTERYSKLAQNVELRQTWVERVGLGFTLPKLVEEDVAALVTL